MSDIANLHLLRPEARPISCWMSLSRDQQDGLEKLLRMLGSALAKFRQKAAPRNRAVPWLAEDRRSQLAFVDGKRGTGKSTLMLTLVDLLTDGRLSQERKLPPLICELAKSLRDHVVILEPLDMEPLPNDTPILAALLARLSKAVENWSSADRCHRPKGLFDFNPLDDAPDSQFRRYQQQIARGLQSNLTARQGHLDREQFGQAVIEQEEDRLELCRMLGEVLAKLTKGIREAESQAAVEPLLFLTPVDDVDLNPDRCLELLRVLRVHSPPQMFFLLMGQLDLVKTTALMHMEKPFRALQRASKEDATKEPNGWSETLTEVAMANIQKLIPEEIPLHTLRLGELLQFKPLWDDSATESKDFPTLGTLFQRVKFHRDSSLLPSRVTDLLNLLTPASWTSTVDPPRESASSPRTSRPDSHLERPGSAADDRLKLGDYPGLHSFLVPLRRLVDLWRDLYEEYPDDRSSQPRDHTAAERTCAIFERHWQRVLDEDTTLTSAARTSLKRSPIAAAEVVASAESIRFEERRVSNREVRVPERDGADLVFWPMLRLADPMLNDAVPWLRIRATQRESADATIVNQQTRSTYVLLHDLRLGLGLSLDKDEKLSRHASIDPVAMAWTLNEKDVGVIPWQLPPTNSFVEACDFLCRWYEAKTDCRLLRVSGTRATTPEQVDEACRAWIGLAARTVSQRRATANSEAKRRFPIPSWTTLIALLGDYFDASHVASPQEARALWRRAMLSMLPEASEFEVFRHQVDADPQLRSRVALVARYLEPRKGELQELRQLQLDRLGANLHGAAELRTALNERVPATADFPLRLTQVARKSDKAVADQIVQTEERLLAKLRESEVGMQRSFLLSQAQFLVRQGQALVATNLKLAEVMLVQALDGLSGTEQFGDRHVEATLVKAQAAAYLGAVLARSEQEEASVQRSTESLQILAKLARETTDDVAILGEIAKCHTGISQGLNQLVAHEYAIEQQKAAVEVRRRIRELRADDAKASHDVNVALVELGDLYLERGNLAAALQFYEKARVIADKLVGDFPQDRLMLRSKSITEDRLGEVRLKEGELLEALQHFERAIQIDRELAKQSPSQPATLRDLSISEGRLGDVYLKQGLHTEALKHFQTALEQRRELTRQFPGDRGLLRNLSYSLGRLGDVHLQIRDLSKASEEYQKAFDIRRDLATQAPDDRAAQHDLSHMYTKLGDCSLAARRHDEAHRQFSGALKILRDLLKMDDKNSLWRLECAENLYKLSRTLKTSDPKRREFEDEARRIIVDERSRGAYFFPDIELVAKQLLAPKKKQTTDGSSERRSSRETAKKRPAARK